MNLNIVNHNDPIISTNSHRITTKGTNIKGLRQEVGVEPVVF